jgi:hypothetical protein
MGQGIEAERKIGHRLATLSQQHLFIHDIKINLNQVKKTRFVFILREYMLANDKLPEL